MEHEPIERCEMCGHETFGVAAYAQMREHKLICQWWRNNLTDEDKDFLRTNRITSE